MDSIYSGYEKKLYDIAIRVTERIRNYGDAYTDKTGKKLFEHLSWRIKAEESMRSKCIEDGLPLNAHSALKEVHDAIGIRIVCLFLNDIHNNIEEHHTNRHHANHPPDHIQIERLQYGPVTMFVAEVYDLILGC